jgi:hypothetical protein
MIRQEFDTELLDKIGNSESVRPFICYHDDEIDWYPVVRGCAVLSNGEDAIGIFEQTPKDHDIFKLLLPEMRAWQAHTLFDATCRGRKAIDTAKEMMAFMLPEHADVVWGATPMKNRRARWFNRQIGMKPIGRDDYEAEGPVELYIIWKVD